MLSLWLKCCQWYFVLPVKFRNLFLATERGPSLLIDTFTSTNKSFDWAFWQGLQHNNTRPRSEKRSRQTGCVSCLPCCVFSICQKVSWEDVRPTFGCMMSPRGCRHFSLPKHADEFSVSLITPDGSEMRDVGALRVDVRRADASPSFPCFFNQPTWTISFSICSRIPKTSAGVL